MYSDPASLAWTGGASQRERLLHVLVHYICATLSKSRKHAPNRVVRAQVGHMRLHALALSAKTSVSSVPSDRPARGNRAVHRAVHVPLTAG